MKKFPSEVLTEIQQALGEEKKRVAGRIDELRAQDPFSDPGRVNDNAASDTEASEEASHDRFSAIIEELTRQKESIERALLRLADRSYGFCTSCAEMIDTDRLAVVPTATLCLTCEAKKKK